MKLLPRRATKQPEAVQADEKLAASMSLEYLEERARRGKRQKFEEALAQVPDVEPDEWDRL